MATACRHKEGWDTMNQRNGNNGGLFRTASPQMHSVLHSCLHWPINVWSDDCRFLPKVTKNVGSSPTVPMLERFGWRGFQVWSNEHFIWSILTPLATKANQCRNSDSVRNLGQNLWEKNVCGILEGNLEVSVLRTKHGSKYGSLAVFLSVYSVVLQLH